MQVFPHRMNNLPSVAIDQFSGAQPVACFYAPEPQAINALRDYFDTYGVATVINPNQNISPLYTVLCGSGDFVKSIHANHNPTTQKQLHIIWTEYENEKNAVSSENVKTVFMTAKIITPQEATSILEFFFTGSESVLDLAGELPDQKNQSDKIAPGVIQENMPLSKTESMITDVQNIPEQNNILQSGPLEINYSNPSPKTQLTQRDSVTHNGYAQPLVIRHEYASEQETPSHRQNFRSVTEDRLSTIEIKQKSESDSFRISQLLADAFGKHQSGSDPDFRSIVNQGRKFSLKKFTVTVIVGICLWILSSYAITLGGLAISLKLIETNHISASKIALLTGSISLKSVTAINRFLVYPIQQIMPVNLSQNSDRMITIFEHLYSAGTLSIRAVDEGKVLVKYAIESLSSGTTSVDSLAHSLYSLRLTLTGLHDHLNVSQAHLRVINESRSWSMRLPPIRYAVEYAGEAISEKRQQIETIERMLAVYTQAGGFSDKKKYLLLLQNSMELRPTGGFIGSVGTVVISHGKIENTQFQDVYSYDGQLKGHVDPPGPVREILKQEHWYLRDSNWDPNFTESAKISKWFFQKEGGGDVDGVIAVNLPLLTNLLSVIGSVDLPDYNDRITAENIFGKSLYYVHNDFFPGSTQKRDFLGSVFGAIVQKLNDPKNLKPQAAIGLIQSALSGHNLLMYFDDHRLQQAVQLYGWAGMYPNAPGCVTSGVDCYVESLGIIDSNLSVNKVNYFVSRNDSYQTVINGSGISTVTAQLSYVNDAGDTPGSGGTYRNYQRIYLPQDAELISILMDSVPIAERTDHEQSSLKIPYYERIESGNPTQIIGMVFDVPPKSERSIVISYKRTNPIPLNNPLTAYMFFVPKQPGLENISVKGSVSISGTFEFTDKTYGDHAVTLANKTQLSYNTWLSRDVIVGAWIKSK